jgi:DNA repair protein RadC
MKVSIPKTVDKSITFPKHAANVFHAVLKAESQLDAEKEHVWIMGMSGQNVIKYIELIALGSMQACTIHPREVFRFAVLKGTSGIILCHNHPSETIQPSDADITVTRRLRQAGDILGIHVLDHIIISNEIDGYFSFNEKGILPSIPLTWVEP